MEYRECCWGDQRFGVMDRSEPTQLLEIYKLHAELADRVSQRREGANRLYVSLLVALFVLLAALLRFGFGDAPEGLVLSAIGAVGVLLSISWFLVIRSYRKLNSEKFRVLHDLEERLPYQFFKSEWDPEAKGEKSNKYWRLTQVEAVLPLIFGALFLALVVYALLQ